MAILELNDQQVVELLKQLSPSQKRAAVLRLAEDAAEGREERMAYAESQIRQLCERRSLNWDAMSDEAREALIDDLVHEDRQCQPRRTNDRTPCVPKALP